MRVNPPKHSSAQLQQALYGGGASGWVGDALLAGTELYSAYQKVRDMTLKTLFDDPLRALKIFEDKMGETQP